jgi:hypothetical protein
VSKINIFVHNEDNYFAVGNTNLNIYKIDIYGSVILKDTINLSSYISKQNYYKNQAIEIPFEKPAKTRNKFTFV